MSLHPPNKGGLRAGMRGQRETREMEEASSEVSMEELQEFLEGDVLEPPADPAFKERLRKNLWEMVRLRFKPRRSDA